MSPNMVDDWTDPAHVGKISVSIMDKLYEIFEKEAKKEDEEINLDVLIKLSQATGYQAQVYSGLQKNHEFAKRLQSIEKTLSGEKPLELKIAGKLA